MRQMDLSQQPNKELKTDSLRYMHLDGYRACFECSHNEVSVSILWREHGKPDKKSVIFNRPRTQETFAEATRLYALLHSICVYKNTGGSEKELISLCTMLSLKDVVLPLPLLSVSKPANSEVFYVDPEGVRCVLEDTFQHIQPYDDAATEALSRGVGNNWEVSDGL